MKLLVVILLTLTYAHMSIAYVIFISPHFENFPVCDNRYVFMEMKRFLKENHWQGFLEVRAWPEGQSQITMTLILDAPGSIDWEKNGNIESAENGNTTFHIRLFKASDTSEKEITFRVNFESERLLPNVERLKFFDVDVCADPVQTTSKGLYRASELRRMRIMECGRRVLQHKQLITNGFAAQEGDWPWHAAIYHTSDSKFHEQSYKCGSTLISAGAVLTAAHCVYESGHPIIAERVIVHVGKYDFGLADPHTQQFNVHRIIIHSGFTPTNLLDDIAIIRLATQAIFTAYVKPICLWNSQRTAITEVIGKVGIVVGWGLNERDQLTKQLSQAHIPVVSSITCLQSDPSTYGSFITEKTFCAGWRNGTSPCNGDSGGGMYFADNGIYRLRGIVSVTKSRSGVESICNPQEYVVFTDVAKYLDWIQENVE